MSGVGVVVVTESGVPGAGGVDEGKFAFGPTGTAVLGIESTICGAALDETSYAGMFGGTPFGVARACVVVPGIGGGDEAFGGCAAACMPYVYVYTRGAPALLTTLHPAGGVACKVDENVLPAANCEARLVAADGAIFATLDKRTTPGVADFGRFSGSPFGNGAIGAAFGVGTTITFGASSPIPYCAKTYLPMFQTTAFRAPLALAELFLRIMRRPATAIPPKIHADALDCATGAGVDFGSTTIGA